VLAQEIDEIDGLLKKTVKKSMKISRGNLVEKVQYGARCRRGPGEGVPGGGEAPEPPDAGPLPVQGVAPRPERLEYCGRGTGG